MKPKPKPSTDQPRDDIAQELLIPELRLLVIPHEETRQNPVRMLFSELEETEESSAAAVEWCRLH